MNTGNEASRIPLRIDGLSAKREWVIADPLASGNFIVLNIPAFAYGVGLGDEVSLVDEQTGTFRVVNRGGNVAIRVFFDGDLDTSQAKELIANVVECGGKYEIGRNDSTLNGASLVLVSLPISLGFPKIEKIMASLGASKTKWEYGNVYDEDGSPLNWW